MTALRAARMLMEPTRGDPVYQWMDGWDWLWMSLMMAVWIVVVGVVVYVAVRLANRPPTDTKSRS